MPSEEDNGFEGLQALPGVVFLRDAIKQQNPDMDDLEIDSIYHDIMDDVLDMLAEEFLNDKESE